MDIASNPPTAESVLTAQRARLLNDVGNAAQASQQTNSAKAATALTETAQNLRSLNTAAGGDVPGLPLDPNRGRNLNVSI